MRGDGDCSRHRHPKLRRPVERAAVEGELRALLGRAGYGGPLVVRWTEQLRRVHQRNERRYAQCLPYARPPVFELAPQAVWLPHRNRLALLAHEVGHVLDPDGGEDDADAASERVLGVGIGYDHRWPGKGLQVARNPDVDLRELERRALSGGQDAQLEFDLAELRARGQLVLREHANSDGSTSWTILRAGDPRHPLGFYTRPYITRRATGVTPSVHAPGGVMEFVPKGQAAHDGPLGWRWPLIVGPAQAERVRRLAAALRGEPVEGNPPGHDARLRELERRWEASGTFEDGVAYARALRRADDWRLGDVVRAAWKGDPRPLLSAEWRAQRDRFEVEETEDGYQVVDYAYGKALGGLATLGEARDLVRFAKQYVAAHGDVDPDAFPYGIDDPLHYDDPAAAWEHWEGRS